LALGKEDSTFLRRCTWCTSSTEKCWLTQHKVKITSLALDSIAISGLISQDLMLAYEPLTCQLNESGVLQKKPAFAEQARFFRPSMVLRIPAKELNNLPHYVLRLCRQRRFVLEILRCTQGDIQEHRDRHAPASLAITSSNFLPSLPAGRQVQSSNFSPIVVCFRSSAPGEPFQHLCDCLRGPTQQRQLRILHPRTEISSFR